MQIVNPIPIKQQAKLYLHLEGTLEPQRMFHLARRNSITPQASRLVQLAHNSFKAAFLAKDKKTAWFDRLGAMYEA